MFKRFSLIITGEVTMSHYQSAKQHPQIGRRYQVAINQLKQFNPMHSWQAMTLLGSKSKQVFQAAVYKQPAIIPVARNPDELRADLEFSFDDPRSHRLNCMLCTWIQMKHRSR